MAERRTYRLVHAEALRKLLAIGALCRQEIENVMGGEPAEVAGAISTLRARGQEEELV